MAPTLFDKEPKPGDLIEIFRGLHKDWAVYVGDDNVVHLIPPSEGPGVLTGLFAMLDHDTARVRCQKIWEVVGPDRYQVNNLLDDTYPPRDSDVIVMEAQKMVGRLLPYSMVSHNCEHFVTELRYGKAESRQIRQAAVAVGAVGAVAVAAIAGFTLLGVLLKNNDEKKKRRK